LQAASMTMAGLAPFFSWWSRAPENAYLTACSGAATIVLVWFTIELLVAVRGLAEAYGLHEVAKNALRAEPIVAVLFGAPAISVWVAGVLGRLWTPSLPTDEVRRLWDGGPMLLPVAGFVAGAVTAYIVWQAGRTLFYLLLDSRPLSRPDGSIPAVPDEK